MRKARATAAAKMAVLWFGLGGCRDRAPRPAEAPPAATPFSDFRSQRPGVVHKITAADLPEPHATKSSNNGPRVVDRPKDAWPVAPPGFTVQLYAAELSSPRLIRTAPNGDVFAVESNDNRIRILRGTSAEGGALVREIWASDLRQPFGLAFYPPGADPQWLYVANTDSVVRYPYRNGDLTARGSAETIVADIPSGGRLTGGGHWTRDVTFSRDGQRMYVSVGSFTNNDDPEENASEFHRADILEFGPDGRGGRVFAWGIRNAVGIAVHPRSGELWASVNERDDLGDNLVPDYITHVDENGFYGWPYFYTGPHSDPRHAGKHPELLDKVLIPDVLLQPHNASLQMLFYEGSLFPAEYRGDAFAAQHGSWNRALRTGYEVIRVPMHGNARATGEYEDFLTGFVTPEGDVWGRPVGVTVASDGALLVSDDASSSLWRVSYRSP
jgi:glucose/arabinose dehydrogenase